MLFWFPALIQLTILFLPLSSLANESTYKLRDRDATDFFWCSISDAAIIDLIAFHQEKRIATKVDLNIWSKKQERALLKNGFIEMKWSSEENNTGITRTINLNDMTYKIAYKGDWPYLGKRKAQIGKCKRFTKQRYLEKISNNKEGLEARCRYNRRDERWMISNFCKELCDNNIENPFCANSL